MLHINHLLPNQINHRPRRAHNNMSRYPRRSLRQSVPDRKLRLHRSELAHGDNDGHDLAGEFAGGSEAEGLGFVEIEVDAGEHGEDEGGGFAGSGLGLTDHVLWSFGRCAMDMGWEMREGTDDE